MVLEAWCSNLTDPQRESVAALIDSYEKSTGVTVNFTEFSYDMLHDKVLSSAAGGNTPDLVWGLPEWVGEFNNMGILEDLTDRYENWEGASVMSESVKNAVTVNDQVIALPYEMTVREYLCHADILAKAGADVPKTWDDILALGDFKDKAGTYPYALACSGVRAPQELVVYLAQKGLEICSAQDDGLYKNTWKDNPEELSKAAEVFQFYQDCIDSGVVDPNSKSYGYEETDDNFVNGFSASYVTGNWLQEKESANPTVMADVTVEAIPTPEDGVPATRVMGLQAHPTEAAKSAAQSAAKMYINGNYSYTHGGGIMCNGNLVIGVPVNIEVPARVELQATKQLTDGSGKAQSLEDNDFSFKVTMTEVDGTVIASGVCDSSGKITFDHQLTFKQEGTFVY